jgi:hypothetical protein
VVLSGEQANNAKSLFAFARNVLARVEALKGSGGGNILSID